MSPRRKSVINLNKVSRQDLDRDDSAALTLEKVEQETTLILQEIDDNLSRANAVINEKMFPVLKKYASASSKVWENVGFWKHFMEEAADVEVKTSDDVLDYKADSEKPSPSEELHFKHKPCLQEQAKTGSDDSSSSLAQLQASTPQQPRTRLSLSSTHPEVTPGTFSLEQSLKNRRDVSSPSRSTPLRGQSDTLARRSSLILKHLNSSPTLPATPILSEMGRINTGSSSSAVKAFHGVEKSPSSDSEDSDLLRLSPVLLSSVTHTPVRASPARYAEKKRRASPNTPMMGSSAFKRRSSQSSRAPSAQRGKTASNELVVDFRERPSPGSLATHQVPDESDEIAVPQLLSLQKTKNAIGEVDIESRAERGRRSSPDDNENVFLDHSRVSRGNSTIYHTLGHEINEEQDNIMESNSKSMSQIFEKVFSNESRDLPPKYSNRATNSTGSPENDPQLLGSLKTFMSAEKANSTETNDRQSSAVENNELPHDLPLVTNLLDDTADSSDMDSFVRNKLKSLTSTWSI